MRTYSGIMAEILGMLEGGVVDEKGYMADSRIYHEPRDRHSFSRSRRLGARAAAAGRNDPLPRGGDSGRADPPGCATRRCPGMQIHSSSGKERLGLGVVPGNLSGLAVYDSGGKKRFYLMFFDRSGRSEYKIVR